MYPSSRSQFVFSACFILCSLNALSHSLALWRINVSRQLSNFSVDVKEGLLESNIFIPRVFLFSLQAACTGSLSPERTVSVINRASVAKTSILLPNATTRHFWSVHFSFNLQLNSPYRPQTSLPFFGRSWARYTADGCAGVTRPIPTAESQVSDYRIADAEDSDLLSLHFHPRLTSACHLLPTPDPNSQNAPFRSARLTSDQFPFPVSALLRSQWHDKTRECLNIRPKLH